MKQSFSLGKKNVSKISLSIKNRFYLGTGK